MTKTAKDVLNDLDEWMVSADFHQRCQLWDVLSALRGPDESHRAGHKSFTTGWIRVCAFPKLAGMDYTQSLSGARPASFSTTGTRPTVNTSPLADHFDIHIQLAWSALMRMGLTPRLKADDAG